MTDQLRIMSANLYQGRTRPAALSAALDRIRPDVLCVQEVDPTAAEVIRRHFRSTFLDPRSDTRGLGVATRLDAEFRTIPMPLRDARSAVVPLAGAAVEVVSVHLANPIDRPWRRTARIRRAQLDALEGHLAGVDHPVVVVGDFNASPVWPVYRRLAGSFRDLAYDVTSRPPRTWSYRHHLPRVLRIDHAFGRGVRAVAFETLPIPVSDHRAIVVDVVASAS